MKVYEYNQTSAALLCSLMWVGLAVASPFLGIISTAFKNRTLPLAISALIGAVSFYFILEFDFAPFVVGMLLFLAGAACSGQALCFTVVKENNPSAAKGTAIAFNNMAVVISGALFQPLIGKLLESGTVITADTYDISNFKDVLLIVLLSYIISFLIAVFLIKEPQGE